METEDCNKQIIQIEYEIMYRNYSIRLLLKTFYYGEILRKTDIKH